ncbi:MAG: pyridoxal-phosphate dependent enzyme [Longimicrobiales bacterium]|nr:pyridoxal-phosphate dependent enzyme [Longimicrobiales bacterium]
MTSDELFARLEQHPRTHLVLGRTPLVTAPRLRGALGPETPEIYLKLDEETGFGLGGNKVRKLEHELGPTRIEGVTHLITAGGPQSNHCRVTAAAAARLGLGCHLVINGELPTPRTGNALLFEILGAKPRSVPSRRDRVPAMEEEAERIARAGGRALIVPVGASTSLGALGYVRAACEIDDQLPATRDRDVHLFLPSSSGGTLAGLMAGFALLDRPDMHLLAVSADSPAEDLLDTARDLAVGALARLGEHERALDRVLPRVDVTETQVGDGYGIPTEASTEAIDLMARSEGILVDPVYTAKATAGMIAAVREGRFLAGDRIVFLHTGGHPALFA